MTATHVALAGIDDPCPDEPWTELGYANRFVHLHADTLRHVKAWGKWLVWDGRRWQPDTTGTPARRMKAVARHMTQVAATITDPTERRTAQKMANRGETSAGVSGALTLAATHARIAIEHTQLDADPHLLGVTNGVVDLRTKELLPHDPARLLTKVAGAAYRPDAVGDAFEAFLARIQPDPAMRGYLARLLGHALEGRVSEHVLPILYGSGANGKGTLMTAVLDAVGDYGDAADPDLLMASRHTPHPTNVADLFGMRLAVLHESDSGRHLAEGTVKRLTGGDRLKARRMGEDFWSFEPSHTFAMLTNHRPVVQGSDEGIWRRIALVPFDETIPPGERDANLSDMLRLESDAVLAWLLAGHTAWCVDGLQPPAAVVAATDSYRADSDALGRFLEARCLVGASYSCRSAQLYGAWQQWCHAEGVAPSTQTAFAAAVQRRGHDKRRTANGVVWQGLGLLDAE